MNYIVQKESLESVADSIRAKAGISEKLEFPNGWKAAVEGIQTGGGSVPACVSTAFESLGDLVEKTINISCVTSVTASEYTG